MKIYIIALDTHEKEGRFIYLPLFSLSEGKLTNLKIFVGTAKFLTKMWNEFWYPSMHHWYPSLRWNRSTSLSRSYKVDHYTWQEMMRIPCCVLCIADPAKCDSAISPTQNFVWLIIMFLNRYFSSFPKVTVAKQDISRLNKQNRTLLRMTVRVVTRTK